MKLITRLQNDLPAERLLLGEPMSRHTSFRIGGAADALFLPATAEELTRAIAAAEETGAPWRVLGNGTNVLVRDGGRIRDVMIRALPFGDHREERLFHKFAGVMRATVKGSLLVAMAQGALGGIMFWILDIRAAVFWGVVMTVLSLIPVVGSALVWLPTALYLIATGQYWQGALLMAYGGCVIGLADNILRPVLVGRDTKLPDFLVLLSTLGGFIMFGMDGFVSGPMLAVFFVTVWQIFMEECEEGFCPTEKTQTDESGR